MLRERSLPRVSYHHLRERIRTHFLTSVTELFEYALRDCEDNDMIGVTISNELNLQDRAIGISFRRKEQITGDVIWPVFEKVAQSNANLML